VGRKLKQGGSSLSSIRFFPADQAAAAHALMEGSTHIGKIVLDWGQLA